MQVASAVHLARNVLGGIFAHREMAIVAALLCYGLNLLPPSRPLVWSRPDLNCMKATMLPVTVVVPTLNEADRLSRCLTSVSWAAQIIVADGGSTDRTREIAEQHHASVLSNCGSTIGAQRNAAIAVASQPWILALDADEAATTELRDSIAAAIARADSMHGVDVQAYRLKMRNQYLGSPMERGSWGRDWHVRFFRSTLRFETKRVHEGLDYSGPIGTLAGVVDHDSYRSLQHHLAKVTTYARWGADDLYAKGKRATWSQLFARPAWRFVRAYLIDGNWRDGRRGLVFSAVHAWSAFAKYALLWDKERVTAQLAGRDARVAHVVLEAPLDVPPVVRESAPTAVPFTLVP